MVRTIMNPKAVIRMPGEAKRVTLSGQPLAFLVTGEDTKHTSMFEWTLPARFSTGLHVHRVQEETFYVLEGECDWQIGDQRVGATPGTYVFIPPGVAHNIGNASDKPARVIMTGYQLSRRGCFPHFAGGPVTFDSGHSEQSQD